MSGKGGSNRRRNFRHRTREQDNRPEDLPPSRGGTPGRGSPSGLAPPERRRGNAPDPAGLGKKGDKLRFDKNRGLIYERPKWTPVKPPTDPLPSPNCPLCGKPIRDIASALTEKSTGEPVHFDCVIAKIAEQESLERGDAVTYIGGGRFGVVHFNSPQDTRNFKIKKILEWEDKENRAEWRKNLA
ncbi:MAG: hypothetical protein LBQ38_12885, partial [Spirochaetaceae bacterium]|nr:hypothetical protein [Spirochaetaceae bacterium]